MSIELDGQRVFEGEIRKAPGYVGRVEECSEVILFTTDEAVLRTIETHDRVAAEAGTDITSQLVDQVLKTLEASRPRTAGMVVCACARVRVRVRVHVGVGVGVM